MGVSSVSRTCFWSNDFKSIILNAFLFIIHCSMPLLIITMSWQWQIMKILNYDSLSSLDNAQPVNVIVIERDDGWWKSLEIERRKMNGMTPLWGRLTRRYLKCHQRTGMWKMIWCKWVEACLVWSESGSRILITCKYKP